MGGRGEGSMEEGCTQRFEISPSLLVTRQTFQKTRRNANAWDAGNTTVSIIFISFYLLGFFFGARPRSFFQTPPLLVFSRCSSHFVFVPFIFPVRLTKYLIEFLNSVCVLPVETNLLARTLRS